MRCVRPSIRRRPIGPVIQEAVAATAAAHAAARRPADVGFGHHFLLCPLPEGV